MIFGISGFGFFWSKNGRFVTHNFFKKKKKVETPIFIVFGGCAFSGPSCQKRQFLDTPPKKRKFGLITEKLFFVVFLCFCQTTLRNSAALAQASKSGTTRGSNTTMTTMVATTDLTTSINDHAWTRHDDSPTTSESTHPEHPSEASEFNMVAEPTPFPGPLCIPTTTPTTATTTHHHLFADYLHIFFFNKIHIYSMIPFGNNLQH